MPSQKASPSLLDEVIEQVSSQRTAARWFHAVAPEHLPALAELRQAWLDGRLGAKRRTAARSIAKILNARGIATIGEQGVEEWLERA